MIYNQFNRNELRDLLKENILKVTFDKKNGDERIMTCTLKTSILPAPKKTDTEKQWKESDASLSVWDTNAKGWRAFCMDKIKSVQRVEAA
jgi:hypothetical protein